MITLPIRVQVQLGEVAVFSRSGGRCVLGTKPARYKVPHDGGLIVLPDDDSETAYYVSARALLDAISEARAEQSARNRSAMVPVTEERSHG